MTYMCYLIIFAGAVGLSVVWRPVRVIDEKEALGWLTCGSCC